MVVVYSTQSNRSTVAVLHRALYICENTADADEHDSVQQKTARVAQQMYCTENCTSVKMQLMLMLMNSTQFSRKHYKGPAAVLHCALLYICENAAYAD